jgi:hypothetical protein
MSATIRPSWQAGAGGKRVGGTERDHEGERDHKHGDKL